MHHSEVFLLGHRVRTGMTPEPAPPGGVPSTPEFPVQSVGAETFEIPTETPESDGTLSWDSTTMVLVRCRAGGQVGVGYTYAHAAAAEIVTGKLAGVVTGRDALTPAASWAAMQHAVRNLGKPGLVAEAISAVDIALWDLYARLRGVPLVEALGAVHDATPVYGSGGFTSYDDRRLADQLTGWVDAGIPRVKIKVGRDPERDSHRVGVARRAIGDDVELFVDAHGAYSRKQALFWAERFAERDVRWLEEPVSSDDLEGLRLLRDRGPAGMDIAAGEYGYHLPYFEQMLAAGAVDCLQADPTRALGISGVLRVAALCDARSLDLSLHCAPQVSAHVGAAAWHLRHLEYFHDHVRIEGLAFDGVLSPERGGVLRPDRSRPGLGLTVKDLDLERYRIA
jgi:L-alanine-DL-glutamate epimerase-like enolase superfamily enzyme